MPDQALGSVMSVEGQCQKKLMLMHAAKDIAVDSCQADEAGRGSNEVGRSSTEVGAAAPARYHAQKPSHLRIFPWTVPDPARPEEVGRRPCLLRRLGRARVMEALPRAHGDVYSMPSLGRAWPKLWLAAWHLLRRSRRCGPCSASSRKDGAFMRHPHSKPASQLRAEPMALVSEGLASFAEGCLP